MLPLAGRPLLDHTLEFLANHEIREVILTAGYCADVIEEHYRSGHAYGVKVRVHRESRPLGTSGALNELTRELHENFVVVYGDVFPDFDLSLLIRSHQSSGKAGTLLVRTSDHPWDSHLVEADEGGRITGFVTKREPGRLYRNVANAAMYVLNRSILQHVPRDQASDFVHDVFPAALRSGEHLQAHFMECTGYVCDMGTPDRLASVELHLARRERIRVARMNPGKVRAVILDRDGTINIERGLLTRAEDFEFLPGAADGIAKLCAAGLRCFIATNQPAIARGLLTEAGLDAIHSRMNQQLAAVGAQIEKIYFSPFHPETHHGEGVIELRRDSDCRKPRPGMILRAVEEHDLDLSTLVMVGDSEADCLAADAAGVRFLGVGSKWSASAQKPSKCFDGLNEAAHHIVSHLT